MNKALILVDFQNEWIDKDSDYYVGEVADVVERANKLIKYCRDNGYKIIFTRHIEDEEGGVFAPGSENSRLMSSLDFEGGDVIIEKHRISPFYRTDLDKELEGIEEVVVGGILTNLCVRSFVQDAYDRDFDITVIKDCCVALDPETQEFTFKDLKATREEVNFIELKDFFEGK